MRSLASNIQGKGEEYLNGKHVAKEALMRSIVCRANFTLGTPTVGLSSGQMGSGTIVPQSLMEIYQPKKWDLFTNDSIFVEDEIQLDGLVELPMVTDLTDETQLQNNKYPWSIFIEEVENEEASIIGITNQ